MVASYKCWFNRMRYCASAATQQHVTDNKTWIDLQKDVRGDDLGKDESSMEVCLESTLLGA